jgi:Arm DNA-binding domain
LPAKNDTYFRHLKPGEQDYKRSDSGGLVMLVTTTGSKLWRFGYRFDSKQKLLSLGQYPVTSLVDARIKRDTAKKLLAEGIDPSVERKEERRNARIARANTFEAVADELMEKFEAEGDAPATLKKKRWLLDFANKEFGKRPIALMKEPEILDAIVPVMADATDTANVIIRPPIVWAIAVLAGLALDWLIPLPFVPAAVSAGWLGAMVFALALALVAWAIATMARAGSNVPTSLPTTTIVDTAPTALRAIPSTSAWCLGSSAWALPSTASGCCSRWCPSALSSVMV